MEKLAKQIDDFSRQKLLTKLTPLLVCLFVTSYLLQANWLFINFISLVIIIWHFHPYLINFEQKKTDYLEYLKSQESYYQKLIIKKQQALKKYQKMKPLDLAHSRGELRRFKMALQNNQKEFASSLYNDFNSNFYLSFQKNLKRKIISINSSAMTKKKSVLEGIQIDIKNLENKKNNIMMLELILSQEATPNE